MIAYRIGLVAQSARRCCRVLGPVANSRTSAINLLADRQIRGPEFDYYRNWLCCTVVHASRAGPLDDGSPDIISRAHNVVREAAAPHADVPADHDEVLDSLRQFDALAGIVFLADPAGSGSPSYGPGSPATPTAVVEIDAMARRAGFRYDGWAGLATSPDVARAGARPRAQCAVSDGVRE